MSWSITKLENILKYCEQHHCLAVFDIDSTILDVTPRSIRIIKDFRTSKYFDQLSEADKVNYPLIDYKHDDWGPAEATKRALMTKEAQDIIFKFWCKSFFANDYLLYDKPYPGADLFVQKLDSLNTDIAYLTARKKVNMLEGTLSSLKSLKFPIGKESVRCVLKEENHEDHNYKYDWLKQENKKYSKIFYFENEAKIINHVRRELPEIEIIFMDTIHSQEEPSPTGLTMLPGRFI